jgi:hypothetical protein
MTTSWSPKRTHRNGSAACWQLGMWRPPITTAPAEIWSSYGATEAQKGRKRSAPAARETARTSQKQLPTVAPICASGRMVRRGSTVRVRQRAMRKRRKSTPFLSRDLARSLGVRWAWSPFWSLAFRIRTRAGRVGNGRVRRKDSRWRGANMNRTVQSRAGPERPAPPSPPFLEGCDPSALVPDREGGRPQEEHKGQRRGRAEAGIAPLETVGVRRDRDADGNRTRLHSAEQGAIVWGESNVRRARRAPLPVHTG